MMSWSEFLNQLFFSSYFYLPFIFAVVGIAGLILAKYPRGTIIGYSIFFFIVLFIFPVFIYVHDKPTSFD